MSMQLTLQINFSGAIILEWYRTTSVARRSCSSIKARYNVSYTERKAHTWRASVRCQKIKFIGNKVAVLLPAKMANCMPDIFVAY